MEDLKISKSEEGIKITVRVIPNSSRCEICGVLDGALKIKLDVPPVEGKANDKCIRFLSKLLGVPKTSVKIISGETSKSKVIFISGDAEELYEKIATTIRE